MRYRFLRICDHVPRKGLTGREVDVELYLGTLHISYLEDGTVLMTGPAEEVFETELPIE